MESDVIKIEIDLYKRCNNLPEHNTSFLETHHFDDECGLSFYSDEDHRGKGYFFFHIKDKHKYFLAKIKYGI